MAAHEEGEDMERKMTRTGSSSGMIGRVSGLDSAGRRIMMLYCNFAEPEMERKEVFVKKRDLMKCINRRAAKSDEDRMSDVTIWSYSRLKVFSIS